MSKNNVTIKIDADDKGAEKGLDKVSAKLNQFTKQNSKTLAPLNKMNGAVQLLTKSFGVVTTAIKTAVSTVKKMGQAMEEYTSIANVQIKAETQLANAARNNPYLDDNSVEQLKKYASQLQNISAIGDEELLPFMAQLASAGRTQLEIQDIMSAALDLSASGMMSLDSAVSQLNKTFSGSAGTLGNQISAIKNLTAEELKNGEAIKIVQQNYKGMAKEVADATMALERMEGSKGDFLEEIGKLTKPAVDGWYNFWDKVYKKGSEAVGKLNGLLDGFADLVVEGKFQKEINKQGELFLSDIQKQLNGAQKAGMKAQGLVRIVEKEAAKLTENQLGWIVSYMEDQLPHLISLEGTEEQILYNIIKAQHERAVAAGDAVRAQAAAEEEARKKATEAEAEAQKKAEAQAQRNQTAAELKQQYQDAIDAYDAQIAKQKELGQSLSDEEVLRGRINVMQQGLLDMVEKSNGAITWSNEELKNDFIPALQEAYEKYALMIDAEKELGDADSLAEKAKSFVGVEEELLSTQIQNEIDALDEYIEKLKEAGEDYAEFELKKQELSELSTQVLAKENEAQIENTVSAVEKAQEIINKVSGYVDQFAEISNGITSLIRQNNEEQTQSELGELGEQYTDGIISYEEYCDKKKEIERKAAKEEYKLKMWEWSASLLQAGANIAQGVAAALTQVPPASYVMAAMTAASGAIQLATIMANKPKPPSFATGGIVPGRSYSGDRVQANVNSGEMILNAQQQRNLWDLANNSKGGGNTSVGLMVNIQNNNGSKVDTQLDKNGLRIIIDDMVNSSMQQGRYQQSMEISQSRSKGVSYL